MMLKKFWIAAFCLLLLATPSAAEENYDGLELLGKGGTLVDKQSDSTMTLLGFEGKYDEKLVGVYVTQHGKQVRFYMDTTTWDKLKQKLIKARDQWETISPTEFEETGTVRGFRVANIRSTMRVSLQGETTLDKKRLDFSLTGGDNDPKRVFVSINHAQVKTLVDQFYKVDELLRN
jgi:hypothetical protein